MSSSSLIWERARKMCIGFKNQFQEENHCKRVYSKLNPDDFFYLLDNASFSAKEGVILLRKLLCSRLWEITATAHTGGFGNNKGVDKELHFNVKFPGDDQGNKKQHFHVRCKEMPDETLVIFDITNRQT